MTKAQRKTKVHWNWWCQHNVLMLDLKDWLKNFIKLHIRRAAVPVWLSPQSGRPLPLISDRCGQSDMAGHPHPCSAANPILLQCRIWCSCSCTLLAALCSSVFSVGLTVHHRHASLYMVTYVMWYMQGHNSLNGRWMFAFYYVPARHDEILKTCSIQQDLRLSWIWNDFWCIFKNQSYLWKKKLQQEVMTTGRSWRCFEHLLQCISL